MSNNRNVRFSGFLMIFALIVPAGTFAQEPATSLDQLKLLLGKGDRITVVDSSGGNIKGRVEKIAPDGLDVEVNGEIQSFKEANLRQIARRKPDSVLNGILIGAGVGFGVTLPLNLAIADRNEKGLAVAAAGLWGLIGAGIGAIVDLSIQEKQMVYFRPKGDISWSINPIYGNSPSRVRMIGGQSFQPSHPSNGIDPTKGLALTVRF